MIKYRWAVSKISFSLVWGNNTKHTLAEAIKCLDGTWALIFAHNQETRKFNTRQSAMRYVMDSYGLTEKHFEP